jgi:hypothetical protein
MERLKPPLYSASRTWYEGAHHLLQYLIDIQENWQGIAPELPFPLLLKEQDIEQHRIDYARLKAYDGLVSSLVKELDIEGDGWVSNERYSEVRGKCDELQKGWDISDAPTQFVPASASISCHPVDNLLSMVVADPDMLVPHVQGQSRVSKSFLYEIVLSIILE